MKPDPRIDRLYALLPAIHRLRDAEQGYPLQALLRVIAEQVNGVEDDIAQLYANLFIETADDWAVPYLGDLIGYRPVTPAGTADDAALGRVLVPRREVANTLRYRRRKGTLQVLAQLARDVAGWPAHAVEFYRLLGWHQNLNHLHLERARTVDIRQMDRLTALDGPFDDLAHSVEVRRAGSERRPGRHNIPSVGLHLWRLKSFPVTRAPAYCTEKPGPHCFTFSFLGQDAPLFTRPEEAADDSLVSRQLSVPAPIGRIEFARHTDRFYGPGKSLEIWAGADGKQAVPVDAIVAADLSDWAYAVPAGKVAVDPVLGRFAFPQKQSIRRGVRVSYHYGCSDAIGGGEYRRPLFEPAVRADGKAAARYAVGSGQPYARIGEALGAWAADAPRDAVIEVCDSNVYVEPVAVSLGLGQTLQLRAADRCRPALRLLDYNTDRPDPLSIALAPGSRFTLDGFWVAGRPMRVEGVIPEVGEGEAASAEPGCGTAVIIRHCTLVPGWGIDAQCCPSRPEEPSLEVFDLRGSIRIEHSIVGSIQVNENEVGTDPLTLTISDSILDATGSHLEAIGAPGFAVAHVLLTILRSTVFGIVDVHAVALAENSLFNSCINVARRQLGCMRFCYVPPGCRTPRRHHCQPDLAVQAVRARLSDPCELAAAIAAESERLQPQFTSERFGRPGYAQLAASAAVEIRQGAEDESEMGVFHNLYQPQREANLRARLAEFTPAGCDVGLFFVT